MNNYLKNYFDINNIECVGIRVASPEEILSWSYGEVESAETLNYRTGKPEKSGLFCEKIFGPVKDWTCSCGKYKNAYNLNVPCEQCGVLVTKSSIRRERMGHITLAVPIVNILFFKSNPSILSLLTGISPKELEEIIYYVSYIVIDPKNSNLKQYQLLSEEEYFNIIEKHGEDFAEISIGGDAILKILRKIDLKERLNEIEKEIKNSNKSNSILKQYDIIKNMYEANIKPEWLVLIYLPVIPPDIRPIIQIESGKFVTTDVNDLYRRVISRNNRLKKMIEEETPEVILKNEKRLLQEAVDCLFANGKRGKVITTASNRPYKSLTDNLKGKKGRFRQNLLGKRVDYSGRSVIVVGPELKLNQCGLPRIMALELFKPYVIKELKERGLAKSFKHAKRLIEMQDNSIWRVLEDVVQNRPVLLNRAPTLHRMNIQGFDIVLVDGKAIKIHPLVCTAYNADFDGDQMAVHLPLTKEAIKETYDIVYAPHNILSLKDGSALALPSQDMIIGLYYLLIENKNDKIKLFYDFNDAKNNYFLGNITLHEKILIANYNNNKVVTTIGKILFGEIFPKDFNYLLDKLFIRVHSKEDIEKHIFSENNEENYGKKSKIKELVNTVYHIYGEEITVKLLDDLKDLGFKYATIAGITFNSNDIIEPSLKKQVIEEGYALIKKVEEYYDLGFLTNQDRYNEVINIWQNKTNYLTKVLTEEMDRKNPIFMMVNSGARGSIDQVKQLCSMRGLMSSASGKIIEYPILKSFKEGITILDYFISSHGARKGGVDTALKTADAGYLTRRLIDVAQNIIVKEEDCGTEEYKEVSAIKSDGIIIMSLYDRIVGRYSADRYYDKEGNLIVDKNELITFNKAKKIVDTGYETVRIRSVLKCKVRDGVCQKCYGVDLSNWKPVNLGVAVGIIAAQSIGEPGTQLTMRTFHTGGIAGNDITQGLPRVEELFEAQKPKGEGLISPIDGIVKIEEVKNKKVIKIINDNEQYSYSVNYNSSIVIKDNDKIVKGQKIVNGNIYPNDILDILGLDAVENYLIEEVEKVYLMQGVKIDTKHLEIIIKQMLRKYIVVDRGDSDVFIEGYEVDINDYIDEVERLTKLNKRPPICKVKVTPIEKVALRTSSFLSAASFQETVQILVDAAIKNKKDYLQGIKENLILGRLIPAGTGFKKNE